MFKVRVTCRSETTKVNADPNRRTGKFLMLLQCEGTLLKESLI